MVLKKKRKTAIGTKKVRVTLDKTKLLTGIVGMETDLGQLGKAIAAGDRTRARRQQKQLIKRLQKFDV